MPKEILSKDEFRDWVLKEFPEQAIDACRRMAEKYVETRGYDAFMRGIDSRVAGKEFKFDDSALAGVSEFAAVMRGFFKDRLDKKGKTA